MPRAAARRHPDLAPRPGRRDHHAVRHGRVRDARPAQDGLPRPAQPHRPRRLPDAHRGQPRRDRRARGPCRSTTGPPTSCSPRGDTLGVFQLDGGPMRALLRSMPPDNFEDISAVLALYRPGPDGRQRAQRLRRPQERPQAGRADPPRARRAAGRDPGRHLRADRLPGAGHGDRPEARGLLASAAPTCCAARWARRRRRSSTRSTCRSATACRPTATPTTRSRRCGTILVPFSDYAFNKAHTAGYGLVSYWTGVPQGQLPGRVHGRRCSPASRTTRTSRRSTSTSAGAMGIKVLPPDVNDSDFDFTPRGTDIRFGLSAVRNVGGNVVDVAHRGPRGQGPLRRLRRLPREGADRGRATSASSSR